MYAIAFHPKYAHPVPEGHRFPMVKYELLPLQLLRRGIVRAGQFFEPRPAALEVACKVHDRNYVQRFVQLQLSLQEGRRIGFVQDANIVERELLLVQGTIDGALSALESNVAFNIAGGTHHASVKHGEGFCMLNDQGIAAQYLLDNTSVQKVLIIDLDVHQGNGTADIFEERKDVFTFSMHCEHNYPFRKSRSHKDIGLAIGTDDRSYLNILKHALQEIKQNFEPDFIFYQSGVDILASDKMGKLNCTIEGCKNRDRMVFEFARKLNVPLQCSMGGGYSESLSTILEAHTNTFIAANEVWNL